jgi:hypothetical protein
MSLLNTFRWPLGCVRETIRVHLHLSSARLVIFSDIYVDCSTKESQIL